eukprot:CAMPEP_0117520506 /NCGR_PEP_ID=MMETSP0784-20121206/33202_1 /TAXON_ID=39447 /ORGANISM="" /LENGTH=504 /DNA_ID=CAMNT_0005316499 /DNA_START=130 /DNA_END=1641 /DNA_ORIENTATION=-
MAMELFREFLIDATSFLRKSCFKSNGNGVLGSLRIEGIVATAIICTAAQLDPVQTLCMFFGSFFIWLICRSNDATGFTVRNKVAAFEAAEARTIEIRHAARQPIAGASSCRKARLPKPVGDKDSGDQKPQTTSALPVRIHGIDWDTDAALLARSLAPTQECEKFVQLVASQVKRNIMSALPGVEVVGIATANFFDVKEVNSNSSASIDIIVKAPEEALINHVQSQSTTVAFSLSRLRDEGRLDMNKLKKSCTRMVTERLVKRGFDFSRSAFRGFDPKVTMFIPPFYSANPTSLPMDLVVNPLVPPFLKSLMDEVGMCESRSTDLIRLVVHWAKLRKICFAPKGYLPPYLWSLLVVYFLQVHTDGEGALLPSVDVFKGPGGFTVRPLRWTGTETRRPTPAPTSVGQLLKEFMAFYNKVFDKTHEVVSIRVGLRTNNFRHSANLVRHDGFDDTDYAPIIEDPCNPSRVLRTPMTWDSISRMTSELARADEVCTSGSFQELFQHVLE